MLEYVMLTVDDVVSVLTDEQKDNVMYGLLNAVEYMHGECRCAGLPFHSED